jgi:hypothetical protein
VGSISLRGFRDELNGKGEILERLDLQAPAGLLLTQQMALLKS